MPLQFPNQTIAATPMRMPDLVGIAQDNDAKFQMKSAMDFLEKGKYVDDRSYIQKSLSKDKKFSIASNEDALNTIKRHNPKMYGDIMDRADKREKLENGWREAGKDMAVNMYKAARDLPEEERRAFIAEGTKTIAQSVGADQKFLVRSGQKIRGMELDDKSLDHMLSVIAPKDEVENKGFTLGDTRYNADGTVLVSNPKPDEGNEHKGDFTLGDTRYRADGTPLVSNPKADDGMTPAQKMQFAKAAAKLPDMDQANKFLAENGMEAFDNNDEFLRAKAAYKTGSGGFRIQTGPGGQLVIETGDMANNPTIGRKGAEQGIASQDRNLLAQIGDFRETLKGLSNPESAFGLKGSLSDDVTLGIIAQLPIGSMGIAAVSEAVGVPLKPKEFAQLKEARSALTALQANARAVSRGVQDDRNASVSEKKIADTILRGLDAKDDYKTMMKTLDLVEKLTKTRTESLLQSQKDMESKADQIADGPDDETIYKINGKWVDSSGKAI